jgi:tyrosyl-tRNA synthetase
MCSPYTFYQFWLNTADADVISRLKVFTFLHRDRIEELEAKVRDEPFRREAQKTLAWEVTSLVHGEEATRKVIDASAAIFGQGDLAAVDEATLAAATAELPTAAPGLGAGGPVGIVELLVATGLSGSNSEARRTVADGGASVNNVKVTDAEQAFGTEQALHGRYLLVRRGKKNMALVDLSA